MVSVGRLKPTEIYPDGYFVNHSNSGIGRSLPSRLLFPNSTSLFDYGDDLLKEDMEQGSTVLDSMFPTLYNGFRRGRHYSYNLPSAHSQFERTDVYPRSNIKVIPIKVVHSPERHQEPNNIKFRLLNGDPKKTEEKGQDYSSTFSSKSPTELLSSPTSSLSSSGSLASPKNYKTSYNADKLEANMKDVSYQDSPLKSSGLDNLSCLDSKQNVKNYRTEDSKSRKPEVWTSIPVHHAESSTVSRALEKPNSNNNSSGKKYSLTPTHNLTSIAHASKKDDRDPSSMSVSKGSSIQSIPSVPDIDPEFEENEINYPPSYPIYDVLKGKLSKDSRMIDYIRGDGNCFFRALSKGLYGSEQYHRTVRSFVVDIIATNKSRFAQFVDKEDVQEHVKRMAEDHCWATTCEIYAAATLLQRDIFMLTPDHLNEDYSWLLFKPVFKIEASNDISNHSCYISLCNTNGNHYDRVIPNHGGCNCFLHKPQLGKVV